MVRVYVKKPTSLEVRSSWGVSKGVRMNDVNDGTDNDLRRLKTIWLRQVYSTSQCGSIHYGNALYETILIFMNMCIFCSEKCLWPMPTGKNGHWLNEVTNFSTYGRTFFNGNCAVKKVSESIISFQGDSQATFCHWSTGSRGSQSFPSFKSSLMRPAWTSYQIRKIVGCGNAGKVFFRHRVQRKPLVSDPGMHHGTCVTHVPWCMSRSLTRGGGENVPGIPGACTTRNFTYLARGPCRGLDTLGTIDNSAQVRRTSFTRWRSGCSQSTFASQWLSRKVSTSPEAASAPRTRERIKPIKLGKSLKMPFPLQPFKYLELLFRKSIFTRDFQ